MSNILDHKPSLLYFDRDDVLKTLPSDRELRAVALSPSAVMAANESGITVIDSLNRFSDFSHARCVVMAHRAVAQFDLAARDAKLPASVALMARQSIWGHAALVQRLRLSLPPGPWKLMGSEGKWVTVDDWEALQTVLLPRIWNYGRAHLTDGRRPYGAFLLSILNRGSARLTARRDIQLVAATSHKLKNGLREAVMAKGVGIAVLKCTNGGWGDYSAALRNVRSTSQVKRFFVPPLRNGHPAVQATLLSLQNLTPAFSDPRTRLAWQLYQPYFRRNVPAMLGIVSEAPSLLQNLGVKAVVGYEANSWLTSALMEASHKVGVTTVVFNHNSQPTSTSAIASSVIDTLIYQRICNGLTDVAGVWSPDLAAKLAVRPSSPTRTFPVRLAYPVKRRSSGPLRVLHAGNYQNWSDFFPWIAETAGEYLRGVEELAATVEKLDDIELIIRVRPKREVDAEATEAKLGHRRNVTVCGTERDFLNQLAECDLLIAHFSTTIEQALQMGKPVLLWGSTQRYLQFSAESAPPQGSLDHDVYVARDMNALAVMLGAIRDACLNSETQCNDGQSIRVFDESVGTVGDFVSSFIAPSIAAEISTPCPH